MHQIITILTLITLIACTQEHDDQNPVDSKSLSNATSTQQQQHSIDAAGVRFNQPDTTFKSLSDPEQQK